MESVVEFVVHTVGELDKYLETIDNNLFFKISEYNKIPILNYKTDRYVVLQIDFNNFIDLDEFMIKKKFTYSCRDKHSGTYWDFIVDLTKQSRIDIIDYLLHNSSIFKSIIEGNTDFKIGLLLLNVAANSDNTLLEFLLFKFDYHIEANSNMKNSMILSAISTQNRYNVKLLLDKFNYEKDFLSRSVPKAIYTTDLVLLEMLIEYGADIKVRIDEYLCDAIRCNAIDIATFLLSNGADSNKITKHEIKHCVKNNYVDSMEFIFGQLEFDQEKIDKMFVTLENNSPEMIELFITNGANIYKYGEQICTEAKKSDNHRLVQYLEQILK